MMDFFFYYYLDVIKNFQFLIVRVNDIQKFMVFKKVD